MEATGGGVLLRRVPMGIRRPAVGGCLPPGRERLPASVEMGGGFGDVGHLRYYASPSRCGVKMKGEKRRKKLVKGLERDLSVLYSMGFAGDGDGQGLLGEVQGQTISEAAETLLAQLARLRAEAKEAKKRRKQEKAAMKAAAKTKDGCKSDDESSSSSESSDSECESEMVVKMSALATPPDPVRTAALQMAVPPDQVRTALHMAAPPDPMRAALQTQDVIEEAKSSLALSSIMKPMDAKIEVCMGGKCKKSGAAELIGEFEKVVGVEGAVVGCKCMGKCKDGPNVRVVNQRVVPELRQVVNGPSELCIGVGLQDVSSIVANYFENGESKGLGFAAV